MAPSMVTVPQSKVVEPSTATLPGIKAEFYSKQSEDLEAKIEAIKRQIAEQQESHRNNMLSEALQI